MTKINKETWKPCENCLSCNNCKNNEHYDPYEGYLGECDTCSNYSNFEPYAFCHDCGRPLADESWKLLEERLEAIK